MRTLVGIGLSLSVVAMTVGCSGSEDVQAAPQAQSPACTQALAAAPERVLDDVRTPLDVAGTLSWGSPAVILRCGLPELAPTSQTCVEINGIDWVIDPEAEPMTAVTYGRTPAAEVLVPADLGPQALSNTLVDVAPVVEKLPLTDRRCVG